MGGHYPQEAGFKESATSRQAAEKIEGSGKARTIRDRLADLFNAGWEGTADDAAVAIDAHFLSVRPRITELFKQGRIEKRRQVKGDWGTNVWTWGKADPRRRDDDGYYQDLLFEDDGNALASAGYGTDEDYGGSNDQG